MAAPMKTLGKTVGLRLYLHISALDSAEPALTTRVWEAAARAQLTATDFNVIRVEGDGTGAIAFLDYPGFFKEAVPQLARSWRVDLTAGKMGTRDYRGSANPPILHRKELLLRPDHPETSMFRALTDQFTALGLFEDPVRIGFKAQWDALLRERGYRVTGHALVPIGNVENVGPEDGNAGDGPVLRHLTALSRTSLSAPVSMLCRLGLLTGNAASFFDYGSGRGDDVAGLRALGVPAVGWDPHFDPDAAIAPADIVNLGFVINVIEDPVERRETLRRAFTLARYALCVSAMLAAEDALKGRPYADGILTSRKTFQRYYTQAELRGYVEASLGTGAVALGPGVFLVFRDPTDEQRFQLSRVRHRGRPPLPRPPELLRPERTVRQLHITASRAAKRPELPKPPRAPKPAPWAACAEAFQDLIQRWEELGRPPVADEVTSLAALEETLGSFARALRLAATQIDVDTVAAANHNRSADILVYLALQRFSRRQSYRQLEITLQRDIKSFFGDYARAMESADRLLKDAGKPESVLESCQQAAAAATGCLHENRSFYVAASRINGLPPLLRVYVGCGSVLFGDVSMADVVRIHVASGKISFMRYDDFSIPLPRLVERTKVNLRTQAVQLFTYAPDSGREMQLLYGKARLLEPGTPAFEAQAAFDAALSALVVPGDDFRGPVELDLMERLRLAGKQIIGTELQDRGELPALDDPCGRHFRYKDLVQCGETVGRLGLPNLPRARDTYRSLKALAEQVLDPVVDWFGTIELTYGFCSAELARRINGRIAPKLDQHAGHELNRSGQPICSRLGMAVDFLVRDEDMLEVARWIVVNTPFDRLYYYGPDRPLHVSHGPNNSRQAFSMLENEQGRRLPKRLILNNHHLG
ncbi:DNA phosphorothioation-associated putative methyltransferase [Azospirillum sp. sgz302134]